MDELTILDIVNFLTIGLTSHNIKSQVPNSTPEHNQFVPPQNLKSQEHLDKINLWTQNQQMMINQNKTKTMIFNFTQNYQFTTRLKLNGENVEVVPETKLLGTIIQNDFKWESNTTRLVKRANARLQLLHKLSEFGAPREDMKAIYVLYIRSILEQNSVVWHTRLTEENKNNLERIKKSACKILMKN